MSTSNEKFSFFDTRWQWRWEEMCGPNGFELWSPIFHDLGLCFQQLCLQIPFCFLFAGVCAYYFGIHVDYIVRRRSALFAINVRCCVTFFLILLPIIQLIIDLNYEDIIIQPVDVFLSAAQCTTWFVHLAYLTALKNRLGSCQRGPILVVVIWSIIAVLTAISFRSHLIIYKMSPEASSITLSFICTSISFGLQIIYALALLPGISDIHTHYRTEYEQIGERTPLLSGPRIQIYDGLFDYNDPEYLGVAMEDTPFLSRLLFYWVHPLMEKGVHSALDNPDALFDLPIDLTCSTLSQKLDKALIGNIDEYQNQDSFNATFENDESMPSGSYTNTTRTSLNSDVKKYNVSLLRALHRCFAFQFYGIGILKLIADCAGFAGPLLLNRLVSFIENKSDNISVGYFYAGGLCLTSLIAALCNAHFNFSMAIVGLKIRGAIVTAIYRKTLTASPTVLNSKFTTGEIVNFMSTDTDRIVNSCPSFHAFWSIPFQLFVTLYLLYLQVGFAFLAGLAFSIILIPINKLIANRIGMLSTKMMAKKDERVQLMTEAIRGIRTIKLHVWESYFIRKILKMREGELRYLKGRKYLDALCVYFWATTPVLISIFTFITYVLLGNKLTAATVFTSIALLNMLIGPLNAFPWVLNGVTEAWVSIKRIQALLDVPDLDYDSYYNLTLTEDAQIVIKNAHFSWQNSLIMNAKLKQLPISRKGKSPRKERKQQLKRSKKKRRHSVQRQDSGNIQHQDLPSDRESFSSKESDNVDDFNEDKQEFQLTSINLTVKRGSLVGIMGPVGSGKSMLLSSILGEIEKEDGDIGIFTLEKGIGFVTQQPWIQRGTIRENILFGKMFDETRYRAVLRACCLEDDIYLLPLGDYTGVSDAGTTLSGGQKARIALARAVYHDKPLYIMDDILSAVDVHVGKHIFQHCILGLLQNKTRILCTHHLRYLLHADHLVVMENGCIIKQGTPDEILTNIEEIILTDENIGDSNENQGNTVNMTSVDLTRQSDNDSVLGVEYTASGSVDSEVYAVYWKSVGHLLSFAIILSLILMQGSRNVTDLWLSHWVSQSTIHLGLPTSVTFYLTVYVILAVANSVFTLFRAFLFAYGGIKAAERIHKKLLKVVFKGRIRFFDISPVGRTLNRFSSDTYTIDDSLPFILNILLAQLVGVIGSIAVTVYGLPWLCLILTPLIPIYHWLQRYYRLTSRELKRLSSQTLSPVYSHFNETLQGLATIRAFRATQRFRRDNEEFLEANQKAQFASQIAGQWLGLRLQFIGVAMISGVGVIAVLQHQFDAVDPGLVGLAISYALSVTGLLSGVVNAFTETEREMIAVERVNQYIEMIEPEESSSVQTITNPPYAWPSLGVIIFDNVVFRFRDHIILKGVTFETRPAEKIGVVGRTGAGKSSLFSALFRTVELYKGAIYIDTVDISKIPLSALRTRLSIIPQDPFLFTGTVRENLDPLGEFRTQELWNALQRCNLTGVVKRLGGLQASLVSGGQNLSVGQRQLLCLARAVLHKAKILCIDEATANVDLETDRQIQQTIRSTFTMSTVITIAHRIQTVMDSNRVIVMDDGEIIEFDSPNNLIQNVDSYFYQLAVREQII